jgi:hypothetical protein
MSKGSKVRSKDFDHLPKGSNVKSKDFDHLPKGSKVKSKNKKVKIQPKLYTKRPILLYPLMT